MTDDTAVEVAAGPVPAPPPEDTTWDRVVRAIERPFEWVLARYRLPLAAGLVVAAATLWLAQVLLDQESRQAARVAEAKAQQLRYAMLHALDERERALAGLADTWSTRPPDGEAWSTDAALLIQRDFQFRAIAWLDDTLGARWTRPTTARLARAPLDALDDPIRNHVVSTLDPTRRVVTSRSYLLVDGRRQVLVRAITNGPGLARSVMIAVMRPGDLFDAVLGPEVKAGWTVAVYEGPYLMYGAQWAKSGPEARWTREAEVDRDEWVLTVRVWPSEELAAAMRSPGPRAVLIVGLALALLVALGVRRIETLSRRAAASPVA